MGTKSTATRKKLDLQPVYTEVAKLLLVKNPEQISFSMVAKRTKVPRTTLYYYFNSNIDSLILESVRFTMKEFMQLWEATDSEPQQPISNWVQLQRQKFFKAVKVVNQSPHLLRLYFRYCAHQSLVGEEIRHLERLYLQTTEQDWKQYHNFPLDSRIQHLIAQIKIGVLWGITGETNHWKNQEDELIHICSELFSVFEKLDKPPQKTGTRIP